MYGTHNLRIPNFDTKRFDNKYNLFFIQIRVSVDREKNKYVSISYIPSISCIFHN